MRTFLRDAIRSSLRPFEALTLAGGGRLPFPPIFIVSLPRSGSTLLYLLAVKKFHLSYFSNFSMACPESPSLLTLLGAPFGVCSGGLSLENSFGETQGWNAPSQGYRAWNRWFPTTQDFVEPGEVSAGQRQELRRTIGAIERTTRSPFINKWQRNATRVQVLHAVFPEAVFVQLRRNPLFTAQSIVLARRKLLLDTNDWFSAKPRNYTIDVGKSDLQQACEQVAFLERDLEADREIVGNERFFDLKYEDLCRDADGTLEAFASWYASRSEVQLRERRRLSIQLQESGSIRLSDPEVIQLQEYLKMAAVSR